MGIVANTQGPVRHSERGEQGCKARPGRGGGVQDGGRPRSVQDFASYLQA